MRKLEKLGLDFNTSDGFLKSVNLIGKEEVVYVTLNHLNPPESIFAPKKYHGNHDRFAYDLLEALGIGIENFVDFKSSITVEVLPECHQFEMSGVFDKTKDPIFFGLTEFPKMDLLDFEKRNIREFRSLTKQIKTVEKEFPRANYFEFLLADGKAFIYNYEVLTHED